MSDPAIYGIDIHTYLVKDPARATAFYRDTMGPKVTWAIEQGAEFELGDGSTFGLWKMDDASWMPGNGVMFAVADAHAAAEFYRAKGVKIGERVSESAAAAERRWPW